LEASQGCFLVVLFFMAAKDWRGFASDFAGPGEIRFDDFETHKGVPVEGQGFSRSWDGQLVMDEGLRQEKFQAMKRKLKETEQRLKKADERRKQRDLSMAEAWQKHAEENRAQQALERKERLRVLQESQQRAAEAKAQRQAAKEAKEEEDEKEAMTMFLTGVTLQTTTATTTLEDQEGGKSPEAKKEKAPRKAGLPMEAKGSQKKNEQESGVVDKQKEKSIIQQLPQLFPGLRRTTEGKQILENAHPTQSVEKRPITKEHLLRKNQIKLMDHLGTQVSEFRKLMRSRVLTPIPSLGMNDSVLDIATSPVPSGRSLGLMDSTLLSS